MDDTKTERGLDDKIIRGSDDKVQFEDDEQILDEAGVDEWLDGLTDKYSLKDITQVKKVRERP